MLLGKMKLALETEYHARFTWVKVQNFQNPGLLKFKFSHLQDVYKNGLFKVKMINCA